MKEFSLLLITHALALAQELPDEDWVCVTSQHQQSNLLSTGTFENQKEDNLPNFMFNPSKGYRNFEDDDYGPEICYAHDAIDLLDMYVCTSTVGTHTYHLFQVNQEKRTFNLVTSYVGSYGQSIWMSMGSCTKL